MKISPKLKIFLIMMVYLLTGCASSNQSLFLKSNKDTLYPLFDEWNASGRFVVIHEKESINAKFIWKQETEEFELRIINSLGMRSIVLRGNNQGINSIDGAASDDIIAYEDLLELIPLSEMRYWLTGNPNPMMKFSLYSKDSENISFIQSGWNVKILENKEIDSIYFPEKINISNSESSITILISGWKI